MNIRNTFINLTSKTYPYGYEELLTSFLPNGYYLDDDGNYYYEVGSGSKTIFASHLDTACKGHDIVKHKFSKADSIIKTNGKTILGADDKAGVTILLYMIHHNVPGLYYFFVGEEVGCIGSTAASKRTEFFSNYNKIVSFDRRGTTSIITHQSGKRSCSDAFADSLSKEYDKLNLKLEKDDTGVYTDSAEFVDVIPECTNISVGYYNEHTHNEYQNIEFLENLAQASVMVNWEKLVIERDPSKAEYKKSNYYYYGGDSPYSSDYGRQNSRSYGGSGYYGGGRGGYSGSGMNDEYKRTRRSSNKKLSLDFDEDYLGEKFNKREYLIKDGQKIYYDDIENEMIRIGSEMTNDDVEKFMLVSESLKSNTDYYKGVRNMFLDDKINKSELKIIQEQCLDMFNDSDREFSNHMESFISVENV